MGTLISFRGERVLPADLLVDLLLPGGEHDPDEHHLRADHLRFRQEQGRFEESLHRHRAEVLHLRHKKI